MTGCSRGLSEGGEGSSPSKLNQSGGHHHPKLDGQRRLAALRIPCGDGALWGPLVVGTDHSQPARLKDTAGSYP